MRKLVAVAVLTCLLPAAALAQQEYATLLAALRYEGGVLVQDGSVDIQQLVAVPSALIRR